MFWQSRPGRTTSKRKWIERAEDDWGAWGTVYADDDGRVLGSMQYGPSELFPRADTLPAGPPDEDAVLITCAYLVEVGAMGDLILFLAAIADVRERGGKAIEAFGYRYAEGESIEQRFLVHRTVFPNDFLADFGFRTVRRLGARRAGAPRSSAASSRSRRRRRPSCSGGSGRFSNRSLQCRVALTPPAEWGLTPEAQPLGSARRSASRGGLASHAALCPLRPCPGV